MSKSSNLTEEEIQAYKDLFKVFDLDGNGTIELEELELGMAKKFDVRASAARLALDGLLVKLDLENDGGLDLDSFIKLMESDELKSVFTEEDEEDTKAASEAPTLDLEKVYGQTPTPTETPALVEEKMAEFEKALEKISSDKKKNYIKALEKCPEETRRDFKLVFLRCEVFDVKNAVDRWINYWNARVKVFGEEKAFLPMTLDGAMKDDKAAIDRHHFQLAQGKDPDGRAIVLVNFRAEKGVKDITGLLRVVWYQFHLALKSESAQKRGVIVYFRTVESLPDWNIKLSQKMASAARGAIPIRVAGMHFVDPAPFVDFMLKIAKVFIGKKLRHRFHIHSGSLDEILASLSKFGLSKETLPAVFGGDLAMVG